MDLVQNACATFVLRNHASSSDVFELNWLPVRESIELDLLKLTKCSIVRVAIIISGSVLGQLVLFIIPSFDYS